MPIYEYEPTDHDCLMCEGRFETLQGIHDAPYEFCPRCGLGCKRVVSRASIEVKSSNDPDSAARRGFTTFKKSQKGTYEKIAGEGPELIQAPPESAPTKPKKVINLDG